MDLNSYSKMDAAEVLALCDAKLQVYEKRAAEAEKRHAANERATLDYWVRAALCKLFRLPLPSDLACAYRWRDRTFASNGCYHWNEVEELREQAASTTGGEMYISTEHLCILKGAA